LTDSTTLRPTGTPPSERGWRRLAALPIVLMLLGLVGLTLVDHSLYQERDRLSRRVSSERQNIEPLTSIRRDARKTYVALLELWLASEEDQARLASRLELQVAALLQSSRIFLETAALTSDEQHHRTDLLKDISAWAAFIERVHEMTMAPAIRREARAQLDEIDQQCSAVLKANVEGANQDDSARESVKEKESWVRIALVAGPVLLMAYAVVLSLSMAASRKLAESLRQQQHKDEQNWVLEGLVQRRTLELERNHTRLAENAGRLFVANEELEQRMHELATTKSQLVQAEKLQAVGQLAAGIAHEINTPIQFMGDNVHFLKEAFVGYKKLMRQYRSVVEALALDTNSAGQVLVSELKTTEEDIDLPYLDANVPATFVACLEGILRIATIVEAMKEFAKPDQHQKSPADLNQALQATLVVARSDYASVAEVTTELGDLPPVLCHVGELNQVFLNLIMNAAQAIRDGVGKDGTMGTIRIKTSREDEHARIDITDSGCGIPDAIRHRVFEPFFTTREVGKGTGQGLAIARSVVVTKHGGTLTFESEVGQGTTFTIRLPMDGT
jgi:signal transduction histidine kinase